LQLNVPEATALIADTVCEAARDGLRLAEAMERGRSVLALAEVLPGVAHVVAEVSVEAVFDDGSRMVVVRDPFRVEELGIDLDGPAPGGVTVADGEFVAAPVPSATVAVVNTGAVPISITSHFHFFEVNARLRFDRRAAYGMRLAIPAGAVIRFDPGATVDAPLTPIGGARIALGFAGLVDGPLDADGALELALQRGRAAGFEGC
jgi:urease subunit gamma/beta